MQLKQSFLFLLIAFLGLNVAQASAPRDPYEYFFNQSLGDFSEELEVAKEDGKKAVMLFFEQDECPFCHYMKNTVLNQPEVQDYFRKHFALFAIDIEGDVEMTDFEGQTMKMKDFAFKLNRVRATPVIAFYDMEGKRVVRYIGKTSGIDEFMLLGRFVAEGTYKKMRFTKYKREQRKK
jgi:thioredoxin-related protein